MSARGTSEDAEQRDCTARCGRPARLRGEPFGGRSPFGALDRAHIAEALAWHIDPAIEPWLGPDLSACRRLFDPASADYLLDRPDLHVVQTMTAVVITR